MECEGGVCRLKPKPTGLSMGVFGRGADGSVTLEWSPKEADRVYQVDVKDEPDAAWRTLSDSVKAPFLRKKTAPAGAQFRVRARPANEDKWGAFSETIELPNDPTAPPPPPRVTALTGQDDGTFAATVEWPAASEGAASPAQYALEMRRMADSEWRLVSDALKNSSVRKKNLTPAPDYVFRYRYALASPASPLQWSAASEPSAPVATPAVHSSFEALFGRGAQLLRGRESVPAAAALAGKVVLLYFSAGWCPPCRQQTATMLPWYHDARAAGLPVEVVFISADRDAAGFSDYYHGKQMPWLALPFTAPQRESIMAAYKVSGIPKLMVFSPSGSLISDNAAGVPLSRQMVASWAQHV